jgi:hypothetical protein
MVLKIAIFSPAGHITRLSEERSSFALNTVMNMGNTYTENLEPV